MISENLQTLRKLKKLTQEEVADCVHVSRQAVAKWENGDSIPDISNCAALAKLYDVTIDELVNHDDKFKGALISPKGKYIFGNVRVGEKGQIVIPKKAREVFNIEAGDELMVLGDDQQGIAIIKASLFLAQMSKIAELLNKKDE
jgi:AbrB family looped-hinge helix DNA binding protein